jgi:TonB family protein
MKYFYLLSLIICVTFCSAQSTTQKDTTKKSTAVRKDSTKKASAQSSTAKSTSQKDSTKKSAAQDNTKKSSGNQKGPGKGFGVQMSQSQPQFSGGDDSLAIFIQRNFKYAKQEQSKGTNGQVNVGFTIDKDGNVKDPTVLSGGTKEVNDEIIRVFNMMPKWKPATSGGNPVEAQSILPIDYFIPEK